MPEPRGDPLPVLFPSIAEVMDGKVGHQILVDHGVVPASEKVQVLDPPSHQTLMLRRQLFRAGGARSDPAASPVLLPLALVST